MFCELDPGRVFVFFLIFGHPEGVFLALGPLMASSRHSDAPSVSVKGGRMGPLPRSGHCRRKDKALKTLDLKRQFVLGHDIYMEKVGSLCRRTLIGRKEYCSLSKDAWINWATIH